MNTQYLLLAALLSLTILLGTSCKKDNDGSTLQTGTMTDIDGNIYKTVKIGDKWWMAENLKVSHFRNGDSIPYISFTSEDTTWSLLTYAAFSRFNTDSTFYYGFLYNFFSISDPREIAPEGWHIPSDAEWMDLETVLGMNVQTADSVNWRGSDQGNKMKAAGGKPIDWLKSSDVYSIFGTNESGFTAIGSSCRLFNGKWGSLTHDAFWWSSTLTENEAWYRSLDYNKKNVFRYHGSKNYGFSIRCVKD